MGKNSIIRNFRLSYKPLLVYTIILTQGIFFLKFFALPIFLLLSGKSIFKELSITKQTYFYISIMVYTCCFVFLSSIIDFSFTYIIAALLGLLIWFLCLANNIIFTTIFNTISLIKIKATINILFGINIFFSFLQLFILMVSNKTINPFVSEVGMSAGDAIMGIFSNSSVNMIISSLFFCFFFYEKKYNNTLLAAVTMILTTYMSGLLIFVSLFTLYLLIASKFSFTKKIFLLFSIISLSITFYFISKENIDYVTQVGSTVIEDIPPRKITSFEQTFAFATSSVSHFLFGSGIGNFSSRLAFIAGGEYVSWYPSSLVRQSDYFNKNHFQLWNNEVLAIPFQDGTANQPFSIYNQMIGEYGLLGLLLFIFFYLIFFYKKLPKKNYGRLMLLLILGYLLLDYWFEYFSVMIILELFFNLNINDYKQRNIGV